jgi:hypothetical protein
MNKYANTYFQELLAKLPSMDQVKDTAKNIGSKAKDVAKDLGSKANQAAMDFRPADMSNTLPAGAALGAAIGGAKGLIEDPGHDEEGNKKSRIKSMLMQMAVGTGVGTAVGAAVPLAAQQVPAAIGFGKKTVNSYRPAQPMLFSQTLGNLARNAPVIGSDTRYNKAVDAAVAAQKENLPNLSVQDILNKLTK